MINHSDNNKYGDRTERSDRLAEILAISYVTAIIIILFLEIMFG